MTDINAMIEAGKLKEAAAVLSDALMCIINEQTPQMEITRENWAKVTPTLVQALQDPSTIKPEPTPDPGDDIVILDKKAKLTITYEGPENEDFIAPKKVEKMIYVKATYKVASPVIEGYTPGKDVVTGKMTEEGADVTVTYTEDEPAVTHKLTVTYGSDDPSFTKPNDYVSEVAEGATYEVTSPVVEGFTADKVKVTGTMGTTDVTEIVTYTKNEAEKGTLVIVYEGPDDGTFVAPDPVELDVVVGEQYSVESPVVEGYTPDVEVVDGTMTSGGEDVTVTYAKSADIDAGGDDGGDDV